MIALPNFASLVPEMAAFTSHVTFFVLTFISAMIWLRGGGRFAHAWGWLDHPGGRKIHQKPTPLHGGAAMFFAILPAAVSFTVIYPRFWTWLLASTTLVVLGVVDDFKPLCAKWRFLAQALVAILLSVKGGVLLQNFGNLFGVAPIQFSEFTACLLTPVTLIGLINAINMIDGADGLAASLVLQVLLWLVGLVMLGKGKVFLALLLPCVAVLMAFLWFNFPWNRGQRATLFMGDAGSMLLGLMVVWFAIEMSQAPYQVAPPVLFLWLLALPLYDTGQVMWRRFCRRQSMMAPDRGHCHHILQDRGFAAREVVLVLNGIALALAATGVCLWQAGVAEKWLMAGFLLGFILFLQIPRGPPLTEH